MSMKPLHAVGSFALLAAVMWGCAPPPSPTASRSGPAQSAPAQQATKTLVAAIRIEPPYVVGKAILPGGLSLASTLRLFTAGLTIYDDKGLPLPYLAETLPQLNTDSWRLLPEGGMETTYRLRPNLTWQDGRPLTPEDFAFAHRIYTHPEFGIAGTAPQSLVEEITSPDARTVVFRWKRAYAFAGGLEASGQRSFPPLPRHLLDDQFRDLSADAFVALPYWTTENVGLGPFKVERWEPGSSIDMVAFDGHALGRPKIDRMRLMFIQDANTALATVLSGNVQLLADDAIYFQQAHLLQREWAANQGGTVIIAPGLWRFTQIQLLPEKISPRALNDVRVRKALAHGVDRNAINDGIYEGQGIISDSIVPPTVDFYQAIDRAVNKYPFDPRRAEQLMGEAGFAKQADGFFTSPSEGAFMSEFKVIQNAQNEAEQAIMAAVWRQVGFDVREAVLPAAQALDGQARANFPGLFTSAGPPGDMVLPNFGSAGIPRPETRWNGANRGSWVNAEYDRLVDAYNVTLDRNDRIPQIARMVAIFSDELPSIALNFNPWITAHVASLKGPMMTTPESPATWNIHEWELLV